MSVTLTPNPLIVPPPTTYKLNNIDPPPYVFDSRVWGTGDGVKIKNSNPKTSVGATKVPLHLVSGVCKAYAAIAHYLGMVKYGAWNYRGVGVSASTYRAALERHMDRWWEGEDLDPEDGTPHLANALACINILIEGSVNKNMNDDRPPSSDIAGVHDRVQDMMVSINAAYADRSPRHYTIKDNVGNK